MAFWNRHIALKFLPEPVESAQIPMEQLLGAPAVDKKRVVYDGFGHGVPLNESAREMRDRLDRYFGPTR